MLDVQAGGFLPSSNPGTVDLTDDANDKLAQPAIAPLGNDVSVYNIIEQISIFAQLNQESRLIMITITFPDRDIEKRALGFLLGRFSGRVLKSGEHLVPDAALEALANENIPFSLKGKATYEQQTASV